MSAINVIAERSSFVLMPMASRISSSEIPFSNNAEQYIFLILEIVKSKL